MKTISLLVTLSLAPLAHAQTPPVAPPAASFEANSSSWLQTRGVLSVEEIGALVGASFSPTERAKLEIVVAARNAELKRLNAQLSAQLGEILGQGDAQITVRIETKAALSAEEIRMERMKRLQPSRYQEMMRRKRAEAKAAPQ